MSTARTSGPPSAVRQLLDYLDAPTLRHLAAVKEAQDPARLARQALTPEGIDRLAEILLAGDKPTIGWWRRATAAAAGRDAEPPLTDTDAPLDEAREPAFEEEDSR
jgi:hypothetical protein